MKLRTPCLAVVAVLLCQLRTAEACTGIRLTPRDGSVIAARTLEFGCDLRSDICVIPRGSRYVGTTPDRKPGVRWTMKYGAAGANAFGRPVIVDGLNEKGLGVGIFYFPGYAGYQEVGPDDAGQALAPWELATFLLGTCADTAEAAAAARSVKVGAAVLPELGIAPPCHYVVHDAAGRCIVLEHVDGGLKVHDNPLGVVTNSPTFDWHVTNLRNYVNLTATNVPEVDLDGIKLDGFGQGTGMLGLPGDFTPPSRFVRAVAFTRSALPVATAAEGVFQAFHILNQFDIPRGAARSKGRGEEMVDYTLWTGASDLKNLRYYFHTYDSRRIRMIDLKAMDLDAGGVVTIPMAGGDQIEDLSIPGPSSR
jgi:choloylglycine hydrolase